MKKLLMVMIPVLLLFAGVDSCRGKRHINPHYLPHLCIDSYTKPCIKPIESDDLTINNVRTRIINYHIKNPEIVMKQVILETGWLKSSICINKHNLFGFKGNNGEYMYFKDWGESVSYYKKWQDRHFNGGDYYTFLDNLPYDDSLYSKRLKQITYNDSTRL